MLNPGSPLFGRAQNDSEIDALQTDVMRFLAIIALCLLAVFAAVSSEMPQSAREMMDVQGNLIAELESDLQSERQQREQLQSQLEQAQAQQASIAASGRREAELNLDVALQLEQLRAESDALAAALNASDEQLQALRAERETEQTTQRQAGDQLDDLQRQLQRALEQQRADASGIAELQTQLQQAERQLAQLRAQQSEQAPREAEVVVSESSRAQPLSLHFDSQRALMTLVRGGRVDLLAMSAGRIWRYEPSIRGFESVGAADQVNNISQVPADVAALAASVAGSAPIQWGVQMDGAMLRQLSQLIDTVDSGQIVVDANGDLSHRP